MIPERAMSAAEPHSTEPHISGFIVNGEFLSDQQTLQRSKMYDALYQYYYTRYYDHHCCGSVTPTGEPTFRVRLAAVVSARFEQLTALYKDELGLTL